MIAARRADGTVFGRPSRERGGLSSLRPKRRGSAAHAASKKAAFAEIHSAPKERSQTRVAGLKLKRVARRIAAGMALLSGAGIGGAAWGAPATYQIDPDHTHPEFEVDHYGMSVWRGLFRRASGVVTLDAAAGTGTVDAIIDMASVDFGLDKLNEMAVSSRAPPILEATKYPIARYTGTLEGFVNGVPHTIAGYLTLHGVTRPVALIVLKFRCIPEHPIAKREVCGADAIGAFNREDFGITVGKKYGLDMGVTLRIQVEAIRDAP